MKKYRVTFYYHTYVDVEVEAENEEDASREANEENEARDKAWEIVSNADTSFLNREIMNNLEVEGVDAIDILKEN